MQQTLAYIARLELEETLANEERSLGPRHPDVASTLTKLADLHGLLGDVARQRELLVQALDIQQECFESPCHEIALTLAELGSVHGELGDAVQMCQFLKTSLTMFAEVGFPDSDARDAVLLDYCEAYRSLTASNPMQSCELLEAAVEEGCFASSDELTAATMMLLAAAHGAMENEEKRRDLYQKVLALCRWEGSSMSIDEASTARARGIFTTRPC
eukprot:4951364-Amphidinium_carterae.1